MSCETASTAQEAALPVVNARELRAIAEAAAGFRGKRAFLVQREDGTLAVAEESDIGSGRILLECSTPLDIADRPNVVKMCLQVRRGTQPPVPVEVSTKYDALFWTESAVEKFLIGYYSRLVPPQEIIEFLQNFNQREVFAVAHLPKSVTDTVVIDDSVVRMEPEIPFRVLANVSGEGFAPEFITVPEYLRRLV